ncbi:MAG: HDIG domain-containing protein [Ignavibacteriaceae bacterium]
MTDDGTTKFQRSLRVKLLIGLVTVTLIVLMFPRGESIETEASVGSIWIHDDLIAPFSFPIVKAAENYQQELQIAEQSVYPVFVKDEEHAKSLSDSITSYNAYLLRTIDSLLVNGGGENFNPTFLSTSAFNTFRNLRQQERNMLGRRNVSIRELFSIVNNLITEVSAGGIIDYKPPTGSRDSIAIRTGNIDRIEPLDKFIPVETAVKQIEEKINKENYSQDIKQTLTEYASHFVIPNILFNPDLTNEEIEQAKNNVSQYSGIVNENERIIAKHDRITRDAKLKIDSYKAAKAERIGEEGFILQFIGKFLHIAFLISLLVIYLSLFRKKIFNNNSRLLLIATLIVFISFVTYLVNYITVPAPLQYLIFIPAASMLITIIFDSRVGFYSTVTICLIAGALRGNDYSFAAMNLFAGALSVYTVRDIKNRSQIFRSFLYILIGYVISVLAFGLERFAPIQTILTEFGFAGTNALISPVLTYGLLIFFERLFKITTDLTLLELSNFDRPLLKDLARKAPGTFNHSMTMGTLAESSAEKVGANPLLARVGAYYHDIGKTVSPQNFVENQLNNQNIHENLTPEESVKLIATHVLEGVELARENNLPQEIIDFIPMHHGTTVMTFFYEKAKKLYGDTKVNVDDYRYPGPRPDTKETAIIMLADSCESAVRSIQEPDSTKVENVINKIIKDRIDAGQLNDSPLTFRDIELIKEAFVSILLGQHHRRIRYPKQEEMEKGVETKEEQ